MMVPLLALAVILLGISAVPDTRYTDIWRCIGVIVLGFVAWHFFEVWGVLAVAGAALCRKI